MTTTTVTDPNYYKNVKEYSPQPPAKNQDGVVVIKDAFSVRPECSTNGTTTVRQPGQCFSMKLACGETCGDCGSYNVRMEGRCVTCVECGWSKCNNVVNR